MAALFLITAFGFLQTSHAQDNATVSSSAPQPSSSVGACAVSSFKAPKVPGAEVLIITTEEKLDYSTPSQFPGDFVRGLDFCDVKVYLTHPGAKDKVLVNVWLPLTKDAWNGRFQGTGGGGFMMGMFDPYLGPAVKDGYAASATDAGTDNLPYDAPWVLNADRTVNWDLLTNFAHRSLADQIHVGKDIAEQFYGEKPHHSYWTGCSQGGRQGLAIAQRYPDLLDGILAMAPAVDIAHWVLADYWPQLVMHEEGNLVSMCEFDVFTKAAMDQCDILDGSKDGVIADPTSCDFDPFIVVGQTAQCEGKEVQITETMARIVRKIAEGPKTRFGTSLGAGLPVGTDMDWLANTTISAEGQRSSSPFGITGEWMKTLLLKDPSFNLSTLTYPDYLALWVQSVHEYGWLLSASNPDLTPFRKAGGKLLSWHGINDPVIPYEITVDYRKLVEAEMGGAQATDEFFRLFLAPGVGHCGWGGNGAVPKDGLERLVDWVENGEPPESLNAETINKVGELVTRETCLYPSKSKYMGIGDAKRASSWGCEGGIEKEESLEEGGDFFGGLKDRLMGLGMGLKLGEA